MPAWIPLSILAGQLIGNAVGQAGSAKANKDRQKFLDKRLTDLGAWYKTESNTPFLQTEMAQSVLSRLRDEMARNNQSMGNNAISRGATAEAVTAQKSEQQKRYGGTLTDLAGYGTQYKDNLRRDYQGQLNSLLNMKDQAYAQKSQDWMNFASGMNTAAGGLFSAYGGGAFGGGGAAGATGGVNYTPGAMKTINYQPKWL